MIEKGCFDYENSQKLAMRLTQGENISKEKIGNHKTGIEYFLRKYKNNALLVLKQLKEF